MSAPVAVLWVCVDCLFAREGDAPEVPDCEPWNLLPDDDVTLGVCTDWAPWGSDPCGHEATSVEHSEDCERESFSWRPCDACGSTLGGERQAYTLWSEESVTRA